MNAAHVKNLHLINRHVYRTNIYLLVDLCLTFRLFCCNISTEIVQNVAVRITYTYNFSVLGEDIFSIH